MILFDTETTGLLQPDAVPLDQQPRIIELAALKLDDETLEERGSLHFLVNPGMPLPEVITKITGLTDEDLKDVPRFPRFYPKLVDFFLGERSMVAHNCPFDRGMMTLELRRLDKLTQFPWPPVHLCTAEASVAINGRRMKQEQLYEHYMGRPANQTHRALDDVRQLADCVRHLRKDALI